MRGAQWMDFEQLSLPLRETDKDREGYFIRIGLKVSRLIWHRTRT